MNITDDTYHPKEHVNIKYTELLVPINITFDHFRCEYTAIFANECGFGQTEELAIKDLETRFQDHDTQVIVAEMNSLLESEKKLKYKKQKLQDQCKHKLTLSQKIERPLEGERAVSHKMYEIITQHTCTICGFKWFEDEFQ